MSLSDHVSALTQSGSPGSPGRADPRTSEKTPVSTVGPGSDGLPAPTHGSSAVPLIAGWACIGLGGSVAFESYSLSAVTLLTIGTLMLIVTAIWAPTRPLWNRFAGVMTGVAVLGGVGRTAGLFYSGSHALVIRVLITTAAVLVAAWLILDLPRPRIPAYTAIALLGVAGVLMVRSNPSPTIDVWYLLQAATHALSHGHNIYTTKWTTGVPGDFTNGYAYLPGTAVLLWPFQALFGDVRYGVLAALVLTSLLMIRFRPRSPAVLLGTLVLLYPLAISGLGEAWIDPVVLAALCAAVYAVSRARLGWAVVAFAVCLSCKQQAWLLLPLAFLWKDFGWRRASWSAAGAGLVGILPWAIANPHAFYRGAFSYNFFNTTRLNALSLVRTVLSFGWHPGFAVTAMATLAALALVVWRVRLDTFGFLFGSAVVMATFNLLNKASFYNEWELAAGLVLAALVFGQEGAALVEGPQL